MSKKNRRKVRALTRMAVKQAPELEPQEIAAAISGTLGVPEKEVLYVIREIFIGAMERGNRILSRLQDSERSSDEVQEAPD